MSNEDSKEQGAPRDRVRLELPSHPRFVSFARDLVYRLALQQGFTTAAAFDLKIIAGEALSNIIKHAYQGQNNRPIYLEFLMFANYIEIHFRDLGRQSPIAGGDALDLSDYRERGLGVFLIGKLSDYHYFDQSHSVGTELVIKKRLA
ncbi:MAG: ATP-binding protein [Leptospirales bacterium]|nr:ATP-binding protein [Leptospirales bacterium]